MYIGIRHIDAIRLLSKGNIADYNILLTKTADLRQALSREEYPRFDITFNPMTVVIEWQVRSLYNEAYLDIDPEKPFYLIFSTCNNNFCCKEIDVYCECIHT